MKTCQGGTPTRGGNARTHAGPLKKDYAAVLSVEDVKNKIKKIVGHLGTEGPGYLCSVAGLQGLQTASHL